jgi:cell wall-associated NlpC family hydrolase
MKDPRTTPMRHGAEVSGGSMRTVTRGRAALRPSPSPDAVQDDEILFGEPVTVFESKNGWSWCQSRIDRYVGYVQDVALGDPVAADHRVTALSTPLLSGPDIKHASRDLLPFNARVKVLALSNGYALIENGGYVFTGHLAPLERTAPDWVTTAERFVGTPYVWGGKTHAGMDCSGLVQIALAGSGIAAPRDTDMQESELGKDRSTSLRQRGDIVFWPGHVGIMLDADRLLHANSFHMQVEIEPLAEALVRIVDKVTAIKRV